jgi:hypothetical protein
MRDNSLPPPTVFKRAHFLLKKLPQPVEMILSIVFMNDRLRYVAGSVILTLRRSHVV